MICIGCLLDKVCLKPPLNLDVRPMTDAEIIEMEVIPLSIVTGYRPISVGIFNRLTWPTNTNGMARMLIDNFPIFGGVSPLHSSDMEIVSNIFLPTCHRRLVIVASVGG